MLLELAPTSEVNSADCIACGALGDTEHEQLRDRLYGAPGVWSVRRCPNCLLGWMDPQPSELWKLYLNYWTHAGSSPDAQLSSPLKRFAKRALAMLLPWRRHALKSDCRYLFGREPGRLLDVGCGSGNFLAGMERMGWDCTGVEFDEAAVATAKEHGVDVRLGSLEEQLFPPASFDAITLGNVIEHLPNPNMVFAELKRILAPHGRIAIITPNINSLGHRAFGRCWRGLEPPRHLYLFNRRSLRALARRAGLKVEACFTTPGASILDASAQLSGTSALALKLRSQLTALFNSDAGEFVVLLATR